MSPRQISFLTSHAEGAWSAQAQRHFDGKPFEAEAASSMPFYGATVGEEARLRASAEAKLASPKKKHRPDTLSFLDSDLPSWRSSPKSDSNESNGSNGSNESTETMQSDSSMASTHPDSDVTSPETSESGDVDTGTSTPKPTPASDLYTPGSLPLQSAQSSQEMPTVFSGSSPETRLYPNLHIRSTKPQKKYKSYQYGTPEMPRGNANLPHRATSALNPRMAGHVKHLPRAEKLPLTGYELLASQLSSHGKRRGSVVSTRSSESTRDRQSERTERTEKEKERGIKPLYRKFESLNHRILLHLQDELSELEEQLRRLDTADTQTRRLQSHILPASRRAEASSGGELQWHKTDILGKIGYKLGQYNHVLSSFTETQQLASPSLSDVNNYRAYLDTQQPIAEIETRFLDASDDLVMLAPTHRRTRTTMEEEEESEASMSPYMQTLREPMEPMESLFLRCASPASSVSDASSAPSAPLSSSRPTATIFERQDAAVPHAKALKGGPKARAQPVQSDNLLHLVVALAVAVVVPVLTFSTIPTFSGRIAVVLLVAFTVFGAQVQAETVRTSEHACTTGRHDTRDLVYCAAVYGAVMSVVASVCA
ncbi:hypothetical protein F503_03793 [Ophiostoma piceae UAMH 11346]|uniref:DUF6594 domain-containing protein n=1 Tax=Ophiostoma piceae (strain UAMH 11346) TaxID=1262450 RepID=S3CG01_OPHP1|nr:hypothetical protein F503_03793 [Ophiostoma piceae UAMH 11346]